MDGQTGQYGSADAAGTACPQCGQSLVAGARFCGTCGSVAGPSAAPGTSAPTHPRMPPPQIVAPQGQAYTMQPGQAPTVIYAPQTRTRLPGPIITLIVLAALIVLLAAAGESHFTSSLGLGNGCWTWVLRGTTDSYGNGGHGFVICVG